MFLRNFVFRKRRKCISRTPRKTPVLYRYGNSEYLCSYIHTLYFKLVRRGCEKVIIKKDLFAV